MNDNNIPDPANTPDTRTTSDAPDTHESQQLSEAKQPQEVQAHDQDSHGQTVTTPLPALQGVPFEAQPRQQGEHSPTELPGPQVPVPVPHRTSEVQRINGVLHVVPAPGAQPVDPASQQQESSGWYGQGPWQAEPVPPALQKYCPYCRGGNPLDAVACIWCGRVMDGPPIPDRAPSPSLLEAYKETILHGSAEGMASEVPAASWRRIWLGISVATLVSVLLQWVLRTIYIGNSFSSIFNSTAAGTVSSGSAGSGTTGASGVGGNGIPLPMSSTLASMLDFMQGPLLTLIMGLVTSAGFFLSALFLYWLARKFGGVGRTGKFGQDFRVHAYLLSLIAVPLSTVSGAVALVPVVGYLVALLLSLYAIRLQYFAVRASMQLTRSKAQNVIIVEFVLSFLLSSVLVFIVFAIVLSGVFSEVFQHSFSQLK